ncbi:MAG: carbon-nitrogen hydrolase family protein [Armatimonadota bacterium]|nr:MAG: carbon-nitrogen hydrolase family protein [Armatimonadota bacterium]
MARYVTVASISRSPIEFQGNPQALLDNAAHFVRRAKLFGADIVAFPEVYPHHTGGETPAAVAESLTSLGPTLQRMTAEASSNSLHLIWPLYTCEGDRVYNSSVLIAPDGGIIGAYHKIHPTIGEIESGITPGTEARVFDTDVGRIGMAICYDLNFPDVRDGLGAAGAEMIFFSSAYRGGLQLRIWAFELGVYVISAILAELGRIVDQSGAVLAESTYEALIARRINLDRRLLHMDYNWDKMDAILAKYGADVSFEYFTREAVFTIASEREGLSVDDVIAEFGLEGRADYFRRANEVRRAALEKS